LLAYFRANQQAGPEGLSALAERMARSLGLFCGVPAALALSGQSAFMRLPSEGRRYARSRILPLHLHCGESGAAVLFNGEIDNRAALADLIDFAAVERLLAEWPWAVSTSRRLRNLPWRCRAQRCWRAFRLLSAAATVKHWRRCQKLRPP
jgi:hypothetical protein